MADLAWTVAIKMRGALPGWLKASGCLIGFQQPAGRGEKGRGGELSWGFQWTAAIPTEDWQRGRDTKIFLKKNIKKGKNK